jgi:outer membrane protein
MKQLILCAFVSLCSVGLQAQTVWTMLQCMQYAIEHNHEVKRAELELDNYKAAKTTAIGHFLPGIDARTGAQYNFGRAIDPETNIYTDVSTFSHVYSLQATLPVFDGFSRIHALRAAKASVLMGQSAFRLKQNQTALAVLQAYANAVYYEGMVRMAGEKVEETTLLLRQTRMLEEVGRKSSADVAQVESQQAEADYELTHQQNQLASALLELKKSMAYPLDDSLMIENIPSVGMSCSQRGNILVPGWEYYFDQELSPELQASRFQMLVGRHEWRQARAALYPSLSLSAGLNTTYFHTLHTDDVQSFRSQLMNNMGEYVGVTLSIPLFTRLQTTTSIRKAKNNYRIACENYAQKQLELEKLARETWQDWQGYLKQTELMEHVVEADSLAYQLTRRQFEEGLSTAVELHATSAQFLKSKATLLQCQLMAMVKEHLVRYYHGETIWK